jgi:hypothetical protein
MPPFLPSPHFLDHSALGAPVGLKPQSPSSSADFLRIVRSAKRQGKTIVAPLCGLPAIGLRKVEEMPARLAALPAAIGSDRLSRRHV